MNIFRAAANLFSSLRWCKLSSYEREFAVIYDAFVAGSFSVDQANRLLDDLNAEPRFPGAIGASGRTSVDP
jgi:hypothetical protein